MKLGNFIATCENLDGMNTPPVEAEAIAHAENTTELIEAESTGEAEFKQAEDYDTGITDAITSMDRLEEARDAVADGDSPDASGIEIATVESLLGSIRYSLGMGSTLPTMESRIDNSREAVTLTMESTMEKVKDVIVNGLKAAWEAVKRFMNQLFQNKEALRKYLVSLANKVESHDGELNQAEHAGFNGARSCLEGIKTGHAMMEIIQATADSFADIVGRDKNDIAQGDASVVAKAIGNKSNDILSRSTTLQGKSEDGKPLRGYVSGNRGLRVYTEGDSLTYERPVKYANPMFHPEKLTTQAAGDILRQAASLLERLSALKKFENTFAGVFKIIGTLVAGGYNKYQSRPEKGQERTAEQEGHKKELNKKMLVSAFRGTAHVYGTAMPRDIFVIVSNIGKYIDACIGSKAPAAAQTQAA